MGTIADAEAKLRDASNLKADAPMITPHLSTAMRCSARSPVCQRCI